MAKATEESVATYLRIPKSAAETLHGTASLLGLPVSRVVNAIFHFTLAPATFQQGWTTHVAALRAAIQDDRQANAVRLFDFSASEWDRDKHRTYSWLQDTGLVEDFAWRHAATNHRVLCSFKVSDTGRVIAELFKNAGLTDTPDAREVGYPDGREEAEAMA